MLEDKYIDTGDSRYGVGPNTNHFSHKKDNFGRDRHDGFFG